MTDRRRASEARSTDTKATGFHELDALRASDAPLSEFVKAGGFRRFTPAEMFPERAA